MTIQRLDNVGIVVDDLAAARTFFVELDSRCWVRAG
jgi:catechol 2,3-dioxygenase-like lactoylglutathione lyase family enzyme